MAAVLFAAGAGVALFDWMNSKGQKLTISDNITTSMSITANYSSQTSCTSRLVGVQTMNIDAGKDYPPAGKLAAGACSRCIDTLTEIKQQRFEMEKEAASRNPNFSPQRPSAVMDAAMTGAPAPTQVSETTLGACTLMCSDVVVFNVQQSSVFKSDDTCEVSDSVTNDLNQEIQGKITAHLKNQEDAIGQLENAFTSNSESIVNNLSSRMSQNITTSVKQDLHTQSVNVQLFNIGMSKANEAGSGAHSIFVNNVSQGFNSDTISSLKVNNTVNNQLRQSADYSLTQLLTNKNDTIGDITGDFLKIINTMSQLIETLTGQILIILGVVLALVMLIGISFLVTNNKAREALNSLLDSKISNITTRANKSSPTPTSNKSSPTPTSNNVPVDHSFPEVDGHPDIDF